MDSDVFKEIDAIHKSAKPNERIWDNDLAIKFGYPSSEALRSAYRRYKKSNQVEILTRDDGVSDAGPKILVFDIEVSPMTAMCFDLWAQDIRPDQILSDSFIICWSAKYLNGGKIYSGVVTPEEAKAGDDKRILLDLVMLIESSDILLGQNIKKFDLKKINTRIVKYGIRPLQQKPTIDTYLVAKQNFAFPSNSLKYINKFLGIRNKLENDGIELWKRCMDGDEKSLRDIKDYNVGDVIATESLYFKVRPFIKGGPNLSLYYDCEDGKRCPNCASTKLLELDSFTFSGVGIYTSYRCGDCGAILRSRTNIVDKEKRKDLLYT